MKDQIARAAEFVRARWGRLLAGAGLCLVLFGNAGFRSLTLNFLELRRLNREILALKREQQDLEIRLEALRSSDGPIERLARRELGYIKKGEIEYRFPPPEKK